MVVRELVTKLSYVVDKSGLADLNKNLKAPAKQISDSAKLAKSELSALFAKAKQDYQFNRAKYKKNVDDIRAETKQKLQGEKAKADQEKANDLAKKSRFKEFARLQSEVDNRAKAMHKDLVRAINAEKSAKLKADREVARQRVAEERSRHSLALQNTRREAQAERAKLKEIRDAERADRESGTKMDRTGRRIGRAGMAMGVAGGTILAPLVAVFSKGIKGLSDLRKAQASYGGLLGSKQQGVDIQKQTEQFAIDTPLEQQEIDQAGKMLVAQGVATKDLITKMKMLGDVAMGDSDIFSRLTNQYVQAMGKGMPQWDELKRFGEAGVPILREMGKKYNLTQAQLMDMSKNREITFKMFDDTLQDMTTKGSFKDAMALQMNEIGGKIAQLVDNIKLLFRDTVMVFEPQIKWVVSQLNGAVTFLRKLPKPVIALVALITAISGSLLLFGGLLAGMASGIISIIVLLNEIKLISLLKGNGVGGTLGKGGMIVGKGGAIKGVIAWLRGAVVGISMWFSLIAPIVMASLPAIALALGSIVAILFLIKNFFDRRNKESLENTTIRTDVVFSQQKTMMARAFQAPTAMTIDLKGLPEGTTSRQKQFLESIVGKSMTDYHNKIFMGLQADTVGVR